MGGKHGWQIGFCHSDESKMKMKNAWTENRKQQAAAFKTENNKLLKGQKRPAQSQAMMGEKNPMFGKQRPNHVKKAISESNKGRRPHNRQELYCIFCKKRSSEYVLKKYHGLGKKECKR